MMKQIRFPLQIVTAIETAREVSPIKKSFTLMVLEACKKAYMDERSASRGKAH